MSSSTSSSLPILILGGGIAGLVTALSLQRKGIDFIVIEAVPEIKTVGAGITLAGNAMKALHAVGVGAEVNRHGLPISIMSIENEKGKIISQLDTSGFNQKHGTESIGIHRAALHNILLENLPRQKLITGKKATSFTQDTGLVTVFFEDQSSLQGRALIAADGIHSVIRQSLLKDAVPRYAGYTCWRGISRKQWSPSNKAVEIWGPNGRFGFVPIAKDQVYWFATRNASQQDERMKKWKLKDLLANFQRYAEPVPTILTYTSPDELFWNDIVDLKPIPRYAFDRVVLIGDAAHATTPNMGQGAGLGIEDALLVAELCTSENLPEAFRRFEKERIPRAKFIVDTSYRLGAIAQWENFPARKIRDFLFSLIPNSINEKQMQKVLNL